MYDTLRRKVKECFILADMGKVLIAPSLKDHLAKLVDKKREIETWTDERIDQVVDDNQNPQRTYRFKTWNWKLKTLPLHTLGVYPRMCELPDRYCLEAVPKTAVHIRRLLEGSEHLRADETTDEVKKRLAKLRQMWEMMRLASQDYLNQYLQINPIIVVKGGEIRGSQDRKAKGYSVFDWDIDDGSSRAVIIMMIGQDRLLAYAGTRSYRNYRQFTYS